MSRAFAPFRLVAIAMSVAGDFMLGAAFLLTWLEPAGGWARPLGTLLLVMLLEFIIIHSSAFMGNVWISDAGSSARAKQILGFGAFYLVFVGGFAAGFGTWWPVTAFALLIANRLLSLVLEPDPADETKERIQQHWGTATVLYLLFAFATTLLPVPRLGITSAALSAADLPGSGLWIDEPHRVVAFGFLYFTASALIETRRRIGELTGDRVEAGRPE